ncbi:MAG: mitochondrial 2-enoyl thioester reductase [Stictis urceolatum]|nr:mitochondrial 2-enoyl thioester reductase [Stictis urceolata]
MARPRTATSLILQISHLRPQPTAEPILDRRRYISAYGYTQAKSLIYSKHGEPKDVLDIHRHSLSPPHSNLLTLRILAAPLNPADINQIQGTYPSLPSFTTDLGTPTPSAVPGNEAVFEVLSAGSSAKSVQKGDWVIARYTGLGTWRTHMQIPEDRVLRVEKEGLKPVHAATVGVNPVTAWRMMTDFTTLDAARGDWFVQNGANSGVGRAALQLARKWGWKNIAVVRDRPGEEGEKLKRELLELGATKVVSEEEVQAKGFGEQVKEWTDGGREQVKLAMNCVGGKPGVALAKLLSSNGWHVTYGAMSRQPLALPAGMLIFKNLNFTGFWVSKWSDANPEAKQKTVESVLDMVRSGEFKDQPVVEVPWEWNTEKSELVDAVQGTLEGYRKGKGLFTFGDT